MVHLQKKLSDKRKRDKSSFDNLSLFAGCRGRLSNLFEDDLSAIHNFIGEMKLKICWKPDSDQISFTS